MGLKTYILKRILMIFPLFILISALIFTIMLLAPGNPVDLFFATNPSGYRQELKEELEHQMGLDQPIHVQYINWFKGLLKFDLGHSLTSGYSVWEAVSRRIGNTLKLTITSLILSQLISIPVGVISAVKQNSVVDNISRVLGLFFYCSPTYLTGLIFLLIFSLKLGWFPSYGVRSLNPTNPFLDQLLHMVLPVAVLGISRSAFQMRLVRSTMIEVLSKDYIITARAKGLKELIVIYKHALKNALLPVVTVIGLNIGYLFGGSALIETVFSWPGLGKYTVQMAFKRDYPVLMGINICIAIMILLGNLISDISYALLDPRIRYE